MPAADILAWPQPSPRKGSAFESGQDESWLSLEVDAMAAAWSRGQRITAREVIDRHPGIADEAAVRLIYEEVSLRRESGEDVATTEVVGRYARWKDELEVLLGCDRLLRPIARAAELPEVGEHLGPFFLRAELGRGASGRTYLASEPTLADRPVVLKVISDDQEEHLSLARLQHTNIIPLFSEHSFPERGLRALCMPYLGGTSLARLLDALAPIPPADRRGRDIIHVLDRVHAGGPDPTPIDGPYHRYLEQVAYVDAVCWIGTRLADALQEAHAHGLVHMDVKPSNVLIAADGLPLLLDFHLACRPIAAGERFPDRIGGTSGWMAPEHRTSLQAVAGGEPVPAPVDHRADIYALGLLLREALGGSGSGSGPECRTPLRRLNPGVSVGLADIIARCLADRPADRYPDAAALADDLRRHLEHRPLRGVANRSPVERWRKWRRRDEPWGPGRWAKWISTACVAVVIAGGYGWVTQVRDEVQNDLREARLYCTSGRYADAEFSLKRGLDRAAWFPVADSLTADLKTQLRVARRGRMAGALHDLAERVRFRYGIDPPAGAEAEALLRDVRTIWGDRHLLINRGSAPLGPGLEDQIRSDLLELLATWAEVKTRLAAPAETRAARQEVQMILDEARSAYGPSPNIDRLARSLSGRAAARSAPAESEAAPRSAYDHYDLGRSMLRAGPLESAAEQFRLSLDQRPQDFWPNFYLGLCEYRLGHLQAAVSAFGTCVALAPSRPECYYNRALAEEAIGQHDQASRDYGHALEHDPGLTEARLNRGILSYKSRRLDEALADLGRAADTTSDPRMLGRIHFNLALTYLARGDRALARSCAEQALAAGDQEARTLLDRLRDER